MPLATILIAMALSSPLYGASQPAPPVASSQPSSVSSDSEALPVQSFQLTPSKPMDDGVVAPSEDICYKIRAYIFKRDDDHAPELVKSTTCGPGKPHAKSADWPKAKVVPAN